MTDQNQTERESKRTGDAHGVVLPLRARNDVQSRPTERRADPKVPATVGAMLLDAMGNATLSRAAREILGVRDARGLRADALATLHPEEHAPAIAARIASALAFGEALDYVAPVEVPGGATRWVQVSGQCCGEEPVLACSVRDVTLSREAEAGLVAQASQDELTALPNRRAFHQLLKEACADPERSPRVAVCVVDVDMFKQVNDIHGHGFGDALLKEMARRFQASVRGTDVVARMGGDEFAILLRGIRHREDVEMLGNRLVNECRRVFESEGIVHTPSISLGIRLSGVSNPDPEMLMKQADMATYKAKQDGRDRFRLFDPTLRLEADNDETLLAEVAQGLKRGEFTVHYQPSVDFRTGGVDSWEALVRWNHPTQGLLNPGSFLPAIRNPATSVAIDDFVMDAGLAQVRRWLDAGIDVGSVAVNLSETCLKRADLPALVASLLERHRLGPDRLRVEVLESTFTGRSPEAVANTIAGLDDMGVECSLDDFGTGVGSLTNLKRFRIKRIKIDRTFVANVVKGAFDQAIAKWLVQIGRDIGIGVSAEGVETPEQLSVLRGLGCDVAQGHLFSRPVAGVDVPGFLARWERDVETRQATPVAVRAA